MIGYVAIDCVSIDMGLIDALITSSRVALAAIRSVSREEGGYGYAKDIECTGLKRYETSIT
jgi:hypothetical protein